MREEQIIMNSLEQVVNTLVNNHPWPTMQVHFPSAFAVVGAPCILSALWHRNDLYGKAAPPECQDLSRGQPSPAELDSSATPLAQAQSALESLYQLASRLRLCGSLSAGRRARLCGRFDRIRLLGGAK